MPKADLEAKRKLVLEEYYFSQTAANEIDQQTLSFKNWSIAVSIALFGWAFGRTEALPMLSPFAAALLFWYSEGLWKEKVKIFTDRVGDLEAMLNGETDIDEYRGPKFSAIHKEHYKGDLKEFFPGRLKYISVMMPHIIIVILSAVLFLYRVLSC
jgi:hypothetical protein